MLYPCQSCGKLSLPGKPCPHCSYVYVDQAQQIVGWLQSMAPEQRGAAIAAEPDAHWPATLQRAYPGASPNDAQARFAWEAAILAEAGYHPTSQSWAAQGASLGQVAAFGIFAGAMNSAGQLVVVYSRTGGQAAAAPTQAATKRCPDCAEEVLIEARICRYCRHEFAA